MVTGFGEPKNVRGECNARLYIGDNFGDNHATMRCSKAKGHRGKHEESYYCLGNLVEVRWEEDEREETTPGRRKK